MPKLFQKCSLSEIAAVERGKFSARPRNDPQFYGGDIPFLQTGDIARAGREIRVWDQTLNEGGLAVSRLFPSGTIFMSIAANVGDVAISTFAAACPDSVVAITPKSGIDKAWLFQILKLSKHSLASLATQNAQANLSFEKIAPFRVHVPPSVEQPKIAEILCAWDEAIEKCERLIGMREHQHLALTHQLVFGQRRLGNFSASREKIKHRWFDLPSDWRGLPIGEIAKEISKKNGDEVATEVLSCSKYNGFVRSLEYFNKQVFSGDLSGYKKIWRGDFGFPSNHVEEGSIGLQNLVDVGLVSPIYTIFRFDSDKMDAAYAFSVLKTSLYRHIFEVSTSASVDRRGSLRWNEFAKIPFPLPSLAEQRAISSVLSGNRSLVWGLKAERDALIRQKRGLMQKLLTGEWRVKMDGRKEAAA